MSKRVLARIFLPFVLCGLGSSSFGAATFTPIGAFSNYPYQPIGDAWGVSPDGTVVVGESYEAAVVKAFRWTSGTGMVALGDLPGGGENSVALGVSADGSVVVGHSASENSRPTEPEAFRWTSQTGMVGLGFLSEAPSHSEAAGISSDGAVIAGTTETASGGEAFRWTAAGGMAGLGDLPGGGLASAAFGISADGSVIVGYSDGTSGGEAFRWTTAGMVGLGDLAGGDFDSTAQAVSADGNTVVGYSYGADGKEAFRWTAESGMQGLGDLLTDYPFDSSATGVSGDGKVIVGNGNGGAFIWTEATGMQLLRNVLLANGASLGGWQGLSANAISPDGRWVVGGAYNPNTGEGSAYIANIAPVPMPPVGWLFGSALGLLGVVRRKLR